ncbi:PREDICTED: uncharacterized protein MAL13P1.304-like [Ceratosolen solmsi marchali]|uniref:RecQ-mediated genome instability protein 1 n=1 Tax=Ceratosolen solmsi marchali TaxID=326594 RepID=A0AAJ7E1D8_9HYME|nr:PREDICTED: uncharacterized protein MAL13P1.304-like [Ceratosolen solmsi marchali]
MSNSMNEYLFGRVKNSLNKQYYIMNNSWLADCIEYYLNDHENPTQDEIIAFVMNQWVLCDLREVNNENGCLPKNLTKQKCITLPGRYILQMEKMYDISTSKYKQLEKIKNISSDNIETTEKENGLQEDKFQNWEPKSKRMLQLFLTDGVQDILAIEYKSIKSLKDNLYPGFKLMIKGPVTCRRGVILLEEANISEVGGEVDSLLISNAVENVFARALNMAENSDPYNDNKNLYNKETKDNYNIHKTIELEDDFDLDLEVLDQIEKQIQQQDSSIKNILNTSIKKNEQKSISTFPNNINNFQGQTVDNTIKTHKLTSVSKNQRYNSNSNLNLHSNKLEMQSDKFDFQNKIINIEDNNSLLETDDDQIFEHFSASNRISVASSSSKKLSSSLQLTPNQNEDDFPMDNEIYDVNEESSSFFKMSKSENEFPSISGTLFRKSSNSQHIGNNKILTCKSSKLEQKDTSSKSTFNENSNNDVNKANLSWKLGLSLQSKNILTPSISNLSDFQDNDFEMDDFDGNNDKDNFLNKNDKLETNSHKSSQASLSSLSKLNTNAIMENSRILYCTRENSNDQSSENKCEEYNSLQLMENDFVSDFGNEFEKEMDVDNKLSTNQQKLYNYKKSEIEKIESSTATSLDQITYKSTVDSTSIKRLASLSPDTHVPQKIRCLKNSPKITDYLTKPTLLNEGIPKICEFMCEILKQPLMDESIQTVVRGKVINIVKLNLLKGDNGSYFYLEGTITDYTASIDVIFSSKVLENIIGYTTNEFSQKRKQSKTDSTIKDQLREDLKKAQQTLKVMDVFMEIELKKNVKTIVLNTAEMTKEQKKFMDNRVQLLKK